MDIGEKYGKLTILGFEPSRNRIRFIKCQCECGNIVICNYYNVIHGGKKSCGCLWGGFSAKMTKNGINVGNASTHHMTGTRLYRIWKNMKERCRNHNKSNYKYYGGRGIDVCDRWKKSFTCFMEDMGMPPTDKHTIDRIDNSGNYESSNCRWSTLSEQCKNRRWYSSWNKGKRLPIVDEYGQQWCQCVNPKLTSIPPGGRGQAYCLLCKAYWYH